MKTSKILMEALSLSSVPGKFECGGITAEAGIVYTVVEGNLRFDGSHIALWNILAQAGIKHTEQQQLNAYAVSGENHFPQDLVELFPTYTPGWQTHTAKDGRKKVLSFTIPAKDKWSRHHVLFFRRVKGKWVHTFCYLPFDEKVDTSGVDYCADASSAGITEGSEPKVYRSRRR